MEHSTIEHVYWREPARRCGRVPVGPHLDGTAVDTLTDASNANEMFHPSVFSYCGSSVVGRMVRKLN